MVAGRENDMAGKKWSELTGGQRTAVLVLGSVQLALAASAWTDLARRPARQINGRKGLWALVIAINWVGPALVLCWGRRRPTQRRWLSRDRPRC
jgi:hypothetical protein